MIFVTVGAQMAFDRLVRAVDAWAALHSGIEVFGQIGPTSFRPAHLAYTRFLPPPEFETRFAAAGLVVGHAGMGTIITALELGKPLIVMPRRGDLAETRNDHQLATARRFGGHGSVEVVHTAAELSAALDQGAHPRPRAHAAECTCARQAADCPYAALPVCVGRQPGAACGHLLTGLHSFIASGQLPAPLRTPAGVSARLSEA